MANSYNIVIIENLLFKKESNHSGCPYKTFTIYHISTIINFPDINDLDDRVIVANFSVKNE